MSKTDLYAEVTSRLTSLVVMSEPGTRLPSERELSEMLGVGRSTVREAVRSLGFLGAVQVKQGDGIYVSKQENALTERLLGLGLLLQRSKVHEVVETRRLLEVEAVVMAAERYDEADRQQLIDIMERMAARSNAPRDASRLDLKFHVALAEASHNSVLVYLVNGMRTLLDIWIGKAVRNEEVIKEIVAEHNSVLKAVLERDQSAAAAHMAAHLDRAAERLLLTIGENQGMAEFMSVLLLPRVARPSSSDADTAS